MNTEKWSPFNNRTKTKDLTDAQLGALFRASRLKNAELWYYSDASDPYATSKVEPQHLEKWYTTNTYFVKSPVSHIYSLLEEYLQDYLPDIAIQRIAERMSQDPRCKFNT